MCDTPTNFRNRTQVVTDADQLDLEAWLDATEPEGEGPHPAPGDAPPEELPEELLPDFDELVGRIATGPIVATLLAAQRAGFCPVAIARAAVARAG